MGTEQANCPVCGGMVHGGQVLVDVEGGMVAVGGHVVALTRLEMSVFAELWRRRPLAQSKEHLLHQSARPGRDDDRDAGIVAVVVSRLRPRIQPLGISIQSLRGNGYRISQSTAARAA